MTFTILHTNDMHASFIGMGPSADYTPFTLNDDTTRGGYARLASLIAQRTAARKSQGPVLVLDAGDYSMGTAFSAATRETGGELHLMGKMGYDATTFGNHEFDLGPAGLGSSIGAAVKAGPIPAILAANTNFLGSDPSLADLQALTRKGVIRRYKVIERGGLRFGIFGVLGKEAMIYTSGGATSFADPTTAAREVVKILREAEKVDVVIALSHGGVEKGLDGRYVTGEDVQLAKDVPGIDVVISGHSHTELKEPIIVNGRTPVVQTGKESNNLGELLIELDGNKLTVTSYRLLPIDDSILGDQRIGKEIDQLKESVSAAAFASRGYSIDQPLAIASRDLPNTFTDIAAGTLLANLVTDSFRAATKADIGFTANGMMRAGLLRGKTGVVSVYDVFAVAPLGSGVVDPTPGSSLVTGYFNGQDLKNLLEFLLIDNAAHPGEYFPRASGMRFRYDITRPRFDVVTAIELGDLDSGYKAIDISGKDGSLYSLSCPLMLGPIIVAIPKYTKGKLALVPKKKDGTPLTSKVDALELPRQNPGYLLPPPGTTDVESIAKGVGKDATYEIKEWQAIMDHLRRLPVMVKGELPVIPTDERAAEVRAIKMG
ncbi:metallophosphoesterase [Cyanobium sp. Copco_Reservoir_LC18]|uniref:bifunctional metallophosphatase/5'-nucleotidase n=1 Tax=Cyanobium sp. Copco_Reservoir_LC18 TaxID=1328305 RepID=UPI001359E990|nr:bifunctional UDP-sugar hydrolase/5'-nucleotidase [Cyanobium sp. Copco_Reservoir_LC18]KAF0654737.1 metallophosphoesterase [Cyanobium sp. Copco_Reservoir_LC18]